MNEDELNSIIEEYTREWKRLFKDGETIYGEGSIFNDSASQYADQKIKEHDEWNKWESALKERDRIDDKRYEDFCKKHPITYKNPDDLMEVVAANYGHRLAFDSDMKLLRRLKMEMQE